MLKSDIKIAQFCIDRMHSYRWKNRPESDESVYKASREIYKPKGFLNFLCMPYTSSTNTK